MTPSDFQADFSAISHHAANDLRVFCDTDQSTDARLAALLALVEAQEPAYLADIARTLQDETQPLELRSACALSLGRMGHPHGVLGDAAEGIWAILETVRHHQNPTLRGYVVEAFGTLDHPNNPHVVIEALKDTDDGVFNQASDTLSRLGERAAEPLITLLSHGESLDGRCVAAWKLGELQYTDAAEPLVDVLNTEESPELLALCAWALGEIGHSTASVLAALQAAEKHPHPDVYVRAGQALKKIARHFN